VITLKGVGRLVRGALSHNVLFLFYVVDKMQLYVDMLDSKPSGPESHYDIASFHPRHGRNALSDTEDEPASDASQNSVTRTQSWPGYSLGRRASMPTVKLSPSAIFKEPTQVKSNGSSSLADDYVVFDLCCCCCCCFLTPSLALLPKPQVVTTRAKESSLISPSPKLSETDSCHSEGFSLVFSRLCDKNK